MEKLKERVLFYKKALEDINVVGSITPSSQAVAKAMTAAMRGKQPPRRILEVGAGTGPITARIVKEMLPGDHLDVYEINEEYGEFLLRRFDEEAEFRRVRGQVDVHIADMQEIVKQPTYDVIISAVPFTAFPADMVAAFFETYRQILKPGGTLTYIEYALGRRVLRTLAKGDEKARLTAVGAVVDEYVGDYQTKHQFVLLNLPPSHIRTLAFT